MKSKPSNQNKFIKLISIPLKALTKVRDLYVRSMTGCANGTSYTTGIAVPLPRSSSSSSSIAPSSRRPSNFKDEDFGELIRAASVRSLGHTNEIDMFLQQQKMKKVKETAPPTPPPLPKSCSVGMARIDEDSEDCEFGDEDDRRGGGGGDADRKVSDLLYPRSKSCAAFARKNNHAF